MEPFPYGRIADMAAAWYTLYGRVSLPWRTTDDPYHVYVSEIMLQQTQVASVENRFYGKFLDAFPSLQALAEADQEYLLKQWEGLGYYSRARNMHEAAKRSAPRLPETPEALMALPGIGRYTAHAVACFGYRQKAPIVDTNIRRLLSRLLALEAPKEGELWELAERMLPEAREAAFNHNQALLDLGALICTPKQPACLLCPFRDVCRGKQEPHRFPAPGVRKKAPERHSRALYVTRTQDGAVLLHKRTTRFLHGYYTLPPAKDEETLSPLLGGTRTVYSHFIGLVDVYAADEYSPAALRAAQDPAARWTAPEEIAALPLSAADMAMLRLTPHAGALTRLPD